MKKAVKKTTVKRRPVAAPLAGEHVGPATSKPSSGPSGAWKFFVFIGIIVLIIAGIYWYQTWDRQQEIDKNSYNGFQFAESREGFWVTEIVVDGQPYTIPFYNHPSEVDHIPMQWDAAVPLLTDRPQEVIISVDPDAGSRAVIGGVEIARITGHKYNLLNLQTSSALSRKTDDTLDMTVVNCDDATVNGTTIIEFIPSEQNMIFRDGACVRLFYVTPDDAIKVADRYAYRLLRIAY